MWLAHYLVPLQPTYGEKGQTIHSGRFSLLLSRLGTLTSLRWRQHTQFRTKGEVSAETTIRYSLANPHSLTQIVPVKRAR